MTMFVFVALIVTAVIVILWGTMALALRRSPQEQVTMEETGRGSGLSITETEAAADWPITPAHLRMW
jgi:hypothetical protein